MELTNEQFKACIEAMTSADHWGNMPRMCADLRPQLISCDAARSEASGTVYVKVRITKLGRSIAYLTGELFKDPDCDKPHATSTCIYSTAYRIQL